MGLAVWDSHLGPLSDWPGGSKPSSGQFPGCFRRWPRLSPTEEPPVHTPALFIDAGPGSGHQEPLETVPASFLQQRLCVAGGGGGDCALPHLAQLSGADPWAPELGSPKASQPSLQSGALACLPCRTHPPRLWRSPLCPGRKRVRKRPGEMAQRLKCLQTQDLSMDPQNPC